MKRRFVTIALVAGALIGFSSGFHHVRSHCRGHKAERVQKLADQVADRVVERLAERDTAPDRATCPDRAASVVHHYHVREPIDPATDPSAAEARPTRPAPAGGEPQAK